MPSRINPDALRAQLSPLRHAAELTAEARFYQAYYGLDLPHHGGIQRRLGRFQVHGYEVVAQAWSPEQPVATLLVLVQVKGVSPQEWWFDTVPDWQVWSILLALGPVACLGGALLGVLTGRWLGFPGAAAVVVVIR